MGLPACRYIMAVLLSVGLAIIYGLKVNLSIAIVSMVNHTAIGANHSNSGSAPEDGPFVWSSHTQGMMLSSYFWGYMTAMFPGSQMAEVVSAKWVFFFAVSINIVCTLLTPLACYTSEFLVYVMRVGEGLGGGVTFPTTHVLLAHWAPPHERSTMSSIAFSGTILGTVISNLLTGVIAIELGWAWVFYIMGALSMIWLVLWIIFVTDKPRGLKFITQKELDMIETSLNVSEDEKAHKKQKRHVPWKAILKSVPFWAILVAHTCSNWGFYMLLVNMPLFMKQVLEFDMSQVTIYSSIPYFCMWIFSIGIGKTLDYLRVKQKISTTFARKFATIVASAPVMACLLGLCFLSSNTVLAVIFLTISLTAMGAMYSGFMTNHIDIANNYAGTLMGITNTFGTIPGIAGPLFVGFLTQRDKTIHSWRIVFYVTCAIFLVEIIIYTIFGKGTEQSWNKPKPEPSSAKE